MNNSHPIDHALALLLVTFESVCWLINELAGFHSPSTAETADDPRDIFAIEAPVLEVDDCSFDGGSHDIDWLAALAELTIRQPSIAEMPDFAEDVEFMAPLDLASLKVVELRKRARGLAKNVHLMRRAELLQVLA